MIKTTNNVIQIPQGETGTVVFYIKQDTTDYPFILSEMNVPTGIDNYEARFVFEVKNINSTSDEPVLSQYLDVTEPFTDSDDWHRFYTTQIYEEDAPTRNTLYRHHLGGGAYVFYWYDEGEEPSRHTYDYPNSSLEVSFEREDTVNLPRKSYYYEISYIEGTNLGTEDEVITLKRTLLKNGTFIVEGGLI